ncbi:FAD-binding protein [Actinomycetospora atypica]|uniref:FAD-binding protein n=1 Tax=Actinomycetospora atypica TaxID=1290095 RepID=A0ABV9YJD6_9PSEU
MTIDRGEPVGRRGQWLRAGRATAELEEWVVGPVHAPYTTDALVDLAPDPGPWSQRRLLAVVGATGPDDVAATLRWAGEHGVAVVVVDPQGARPRRDAMDRPTVAISLSRVDRVRLDADGATVRAGVGAAFPAVHRVAQAHRAAPSDLLCRRGTVGHGVDGLTRCGVTLVTGDGVIHHLGTGGGDRDLWWAHRVRPDRVGVVTEVVLDPWDTTVRFGRPAWSAGDEARLATIRRRHDPDRVLG